MAILMPALMRAKELGKRMVCSNHVRSLGLANVVYAEESDGWYVPIIYRPQAVAAPARSAGPRTSSSESCWATRPGRARARATGTPRRSSAAQAIWSACRNARIDSTATS
jgi:hypothetical protein